MAKLSTEKVCKILGGLNPSSISRYIRMGKIAAPEKTLVGRLPTRLWSPRDIERLKHDLLHLPDGRKTRKKSSR